MHNGRVPYDKDFERILKAHMMKWKEKRKLERFNLELPAQISLMHSNLQDKIDVQTSNICSSGAFFKILRPLPVGTAVRVSLYLALNRFDALKDYCRRSQINVTGTVIRCEPSGMSIRFDTEYKMHPFKGNSASEIITDENQL